MSRLRGRAVLVMVATLIAAAACSSSSRHAAPPPTSVGSGTATSTTQELNLALPPVPPVSWQPCVGTAGPQGYDCVTLEVPLNYAEPNGTKIGIALDRHAATGTKIGSLLTNPGGPGASGVDFVPDLVAFLSPSVLAHFDIVGFDPRGVGRSDPVVCENGPELDQYFHLDQAPTTEAGFNEFLAAAKLFDQRCQAMSGGLLPYVGTVNAARDMDEIRSAVGDAKLSYLGFSYGTFLGATYAELFPTHIRAMVLDGPVNPAEDPIPSYADQAVAFQKELGAFFTYCSQDSTCAWQPGGALQTAYDALMARIAAQPLPGEGTRTLGPGEAFFGVSVALYDQSSWPALAMGLAAAEAGDGSVLLQYSDQYTSRSPAGAYDNLLEANVAISCVDVPWPRDPAVVQRAAEAAAAQAPDFGQQDVYELGLPCSAWPVPAVGVPHAITAAGSPPIVVVGSTGDPATPYADSQAIASQLQHGVLLTRVGNGHTGYRSSACIRSHVDSYLIDLTVPAPGISCPSP